MSHIFEQFCAPLKRRPLQCGVSRAYRYATGVNVVRNVRGLCEGYEGVALVTYSCHADLVVLQYNNTKSLSLSTQIGTILIK